MRYRGERGVEGDARRLRTAVTIHSGKPALNLPARSVAEKANASSVPASDFKRRKGSEPGKSKYKRLAPNPIAQADCGKGKRLRGPRLKFQTLRLPELSGHK